MSIDRIPTPGVPGELFLCARSDAAPDPEGALAAADGAALLVCLNEGSELAVDYLDYVDWLTEHAGGRAMWHPVRNWSAGPLKVALPVIRLIAERIGRGDGVVVHCALGQGRAGTMAVCVLMTLGVDRDEALRSVGTHRHNAGPVSPDQWALVDELEAYLVGVIPPRAS